MTKEYRVTEELLTELIKHCGLQLTGKSICAAVKAQAVIDAGPIGTIVGPQIIRELKAAITEAEHPNNMMTNGVQTALVSLGVLKRLVMLATNEVNQRDPITANSTELEALCNTEQMLRRRLERVRQLAYQEGYRDGELSLQHKCAKLERALESMRQS